MTSADQAEELDGDLTTGAPRTRPSTGGPDGCPRDRATR